MSIIEMYTRTDCSRCISLKEILRKENVKFTEYTIGVNVTRDEVIAKFPDKKQLPIVVYNAVVLADGDQLVKLIMEKKANDNSS